MPPIIRKIPPELAPDIGRLVEVELYTYAAVAQHLEDEHALKVTAEAVRQFYWRWKAQDELSAPEGQIPPADEAVDPADALQAMRYTLAKDAATARRRLALDPQCKVTASLYLGLQSLRVRLLIALGAKGAARKVENETKPADEKPRQPVARFVVGGKPVVMPS
jgi:hypothetical protein